LSSDLTEKILFLLKDSKPQSVRELSDMLQQKYNLTENEILVLILKLQAEGLMDLKNLKVENNFREYLVGTETIWYWITIGMGVFATFLFFTVSETLYPMIYLRNFTGLFLVLFLPGYILIRLLFPIMATTRHRKIETIQRVALSLGISAVLVTIISLLVYYSPWGLDLSVIIFSILILTSVLATASLLREYRIKKFKFREADNPFSG
jgi:uncharacterized membrane protein